MLLVFDPAIRAILAAKAVLQSMHAVPEGAPDLGLHSGKVFGVNALPPEIGVLEVVARVIAKHALDVVADECGTERSSGLEAVDHGRRRTQQLRQALLQDGLHRGGALAKL